VKAFKILILLLLSNCLFAQKQLTEVEALSLALKNSAYSKAATMSVTQSKQLQNTAYNFGNLQVLMESPSGLFQTVGAIQSFDFPTVYAKQHQLLKQQTVLSQVGQQVTENDIKYQIKSLYLAIQYYGALANQYKIRDSLYDKIKQSAQRQYDAGQIDYLEKTFTDAQYGETHNQFIQTQTDLKVALSQLQSFIGLNGNIVVTVFQKAPLLQSIIEVNQDSTAVANSPSLLYIKQQQIISSKNLALQRNRFLPGLTIGYLNQGQDQNTSSFLRLRAGITLPIWFWQYTSSIKAAKTGVKIAEQKTLAGQKTLTLQIQQAKGDYLKYSQSLEYYETSGLKQTDDIISTSKRFFEGGHEFDYILYLRNINDAYIIKQKYLENLKGFNQSIININYLSGNL
jgi:cobalt-zinc-cadmium efflux system outer membrane protein